MGIAAKAPRGGLAERLAGASRVLVLRNAEIERFEDQRGSVFDLWEGFFGRGAKPTAAAVRDLVALGLVGGGMPDEKADALVEGLGPDANPQLFKIGQALLGVAFMPDAADDDDSEAERPRKHVKEPASKKKTGPAAGTSGE